MALQFDINKANGFSILLLDGATPMTGETSSSVTQYASKTGGASFQPSYLDFQEIDSTNMPGVYFVEFDSGTFDTEGEIIFSFTGSNFNTYRVRGEVREFDVAEIKGSNFDPTTDALPNIRDKIDSSSSNITDDLSDIKGSGYDPSTESLTEQASSLRDVADKTKRILGLSDENVRITDYTYNQDNEVTSATLKIYPTKTDLENQTNPLNRYEMIAEYDDQGRLKDYRIKRKS